MKLEWTGEVECNSVRLNEQLECDSKLKINLEVREWNGQVVECYNKRKIHIKVRVRRWNGQVRSSVTVLG